MDAGTGDALEAAERQIVGHRHAGEQAAPLRRSRCHAARSFGRPRFTVAQELDRPGLRPRNADRALQQGRFAGAVAPEQRDLVLTDVEGHGIEDVALAIERVDAVDREQLLRARRRGARPGRDGRSAGADIDLRTLASLRATSTVPSTRTCPSFMTVTWSAIWKTRSMSCSTNKTGSRRTWSSPARRCADVRPPQGPPTAHRAAGHGASPAQGPCRAGAGRHRTVTPPRRAPCRRPRGDQLRRFRRDVGKIVRSPPEREAAGMARLHRQAQVFLNRQRREQIGDLERAADALGRDVLGTQASDRVPRKLDRAAVGREKAESRLNAVVLPAPFGPISACSVRSRTVKETSSTA